MSATFQIAIGVVGGTAIENRDRKIELSSF